MKKLPCRVIFIDSNVPNEVLRLSNHTFGLDQNDSAEKIQSS